MDPDPSRLDDVLPSSEHTRAESASEVTRVDPADRITVPEDGPGPSNALHAVLNSGPVSPGASVEGAELGAYVIEKELGRGGMGVVYRARHKEDGRVVALKVLLRGSQASHKQRQRFLRESAAVSKLDHPGIVRVHDRGEADGLLYIALEFVDGQELTQLIETLKLPQLVETMILISRALGHAHENGIVHRDMKPANVLIRHLDDQPVIADFGLARDLDMSSSLTKTGANLGTPWYMAPEQLGKKGHSPATDVYALGVMLYEGLLGYHPFSNVDSAIDLFADIATRVPTAPDQLNHRIPRELSAICLKALEKDAANRQPDGNAFADDLEAYLHGSRKTVESGGSSKRIWLALFAVGTALLIGLGWWLGRGTPTPDVAQPTPPAEEGPDSAPAGPVHTVELTPKLETLLLGALTPVPDRPARSRRAFRTNPLLARTPALREKILTFLQGYRVNAISPEEVKQAYIVVYGGSSLAGYALLECTTQEAAKELVAQLKDVPNQWGAHRGALVVIVFQPRRNFRFVFEHFARQLSDELGVEPPQGMAGPELRALYPPAGFVPAGLPQPRTAYRTLCAGEQVAPQLKTLRLELPADAFERVFEWYALGQTPEGGFKLRFCVAELRDPAVGKQLGALWPTIATPDPNQEFQGPLRVGSRFAVFTWLRVEPNSPEHRDALRERVTAGLEDMVAKAAAKFPPN